MDPRFEVLPPGPPGQRPPDMRSAKPKAQGIMAWLAAGAVAIAKFKFAIYGALKMSLSMLVTIWLYAMLFGWKFSIGFVLLLFVHEMGHVIAAKWVGIPISAPIFIPFMGAAIIMKQNPRDAWTEALMAYGGPLAGCLGGWACLALALQLNQPWIMAVASVTFVLNLFNMIPIPPLDGGRICSAVSAWFWIIGLLLLGASLYFFHGFFSIIIIVIVLFAAWPRIKQTLFYPPTPEMQAYYQVHPGKRLLMALLYLGLLAVLLQGYVTANGYLRPVQSGY